LAGPPPPQNKTGKDFFDFCPQQNGPTVPFYISDISI